MERESVGKTNIWFARRSHVIPGARVAAVNDIVICGFDGAGCGGIEAAAKLGLLPHFLCTGQGGECMSIKSEN